MLAQSRREGTIEGSQADLLSGALDLAERPVRESWCPATRSWRCRCAPPMAEVERPRQRARALPAPRHRARPR